MANTVSQIMHQTKPWLLLAWVIISVSALESSAQSISVTHCQGECPRYESQLAADRAKLVVHHLYAAGLNGDTGLADWSAYRLTSDAVGVASLLPRTWQPDRLTEFSPLEDLIVTENAELSLSEVATVSSNPYAGLSAEQTPPENRARLAPMTSFANTPYWSDLNNLSNMMPMPTPLRRGAWLQLEQRLNRLVAAKGELYVIAGPLFLISNLSLNPTSAELNPAAYFKVVADDSGIAAFVFPEQLGQFESFCAHQASLPEIEQMAGLDLFPGRRKTEVSAALLDQLGCKGG